MTISIKEKRRWLGGDGVFEVTLTVPKLMLFSLASEMSRLQTAFDNDSESFVDDEKIAKCARGIGMALSYANCPLSEIKTAMLEALSCGRPLTEEQIEDWWIAESDFVQVANILRLGDIMIGENLSNADKRFLRYAARKLLTTAGLSGVDRTILNDITRRVLGDDLAREALAEIEKEKREGIEKMREAGRQRLAD